MSRVKQGTSASKDTYRHAVLETLWGFRALAYEVQRVDEKWEEARRRVGGKRRHWEKRRRQCDTARPEIAKGLIRIENLCERAGICVPVSSWKAPPWLQDEWYEIAKFLIDAIDSGVLRLIEEKRLE